MGRVAFAGKAHIIPWPLYRIQKGEEEKTPPHPSRTVLRLRSGRTDSPTRGTLGMASRTNLKEELGLSLSEA